MKRTTVRLVPVLVCAALAPAGLALLNLGCGTGGPTSPAPVPLRVRVEFAPDAFTKAGLSPQAAALDRMRARALEVQADDSTILRDSTSVAVNPEDTTFRLVLRVPPAALYRVEVEALLGGAVQFGGSVEVPHVEAGGSSEPTVTLEPVAFVAPPTGLAAQAAAPRTVSLQWIDQASNETGYEIQREGPGPGQFAVHRTLSGTFTGTVAFSDTVNLVPGSDYLYRVRALGAQGNSDFSNVAPVHTPLPAPVILTVSENGPGALRTRWTYGAPDPGVFQIQRRQGTGAFASAGTAAGSARLFDDSGLAGGATFIYRLRAVAGADTSAWSSEASGTTASEAPVCQVSGSDIGFGPIKVDSSAVRSFSVTNAGGGTLTGTVALNCPGTGDFTVSQGAGPFSLGANEARTVSVTFSPTASATRTCEVDLGTACDPVNLSGTGFTGAICALAPASYDFGTVAVGDSATIVFVLSNTGDRTLTGTVAVLDCTGFALTSGAGAYSLEPGNARDVTVRFRPTQPGSFGCTLNAGGCSASIYGNGGLNPVCSVSPTVLDFGSVEEGSFADRTFSIQNTGGGTLSGTVSASCTGYSLPSGGGSYTLGAGQSRTVTVRFTPPASGTFTCSVATGSDCAGVAATGTGTAAAVCGVSPASLSFGTVAVGSSVDKTFTITNQGGGTLSGSVTSACPDFQIVSGGGAFSLGAGQGRTVTVRFQPAAGGSSSCTVATGTQCRDVPVDGTGQLPPTCSIEPDTLDFGTVLLRQYQERTFTITNVGGGFLTGSVSESCPAYSLTAGSGFYSLTSGQSKSVTVRFTPTAIGTSICSVATGTGCPPVVVRGVGEAAPVCSVSATSLDFGQTPIYTDSIRTVVITNTGGQTLTGDAQLLDCAGFGIVSGSGGPFALGAGESDTVSIDFFPQNNQGYQCSLDLGTGCPPVTLFGTGVVGPIATVNPTSLDMGTVSVTVNGYNERVFTVENTGDQTLNGTVAVGSGTYSAYFSITSGGGAYSLAPGQIRSVRVRYKPTTAGTHGVYIGLGPDAPLVPALGYGAIASVSPTYIDFGYVYSTKDTSVVIRNDGAGTLVGQVSESCEPYQVVSGGGNFSLTAGQSITVIVRCAPTYNDYGNIPCTIATGANCPDVSVTAYALTGGYKPQGRGKP